ncbi:MAG: hypothetical protein IK063_06330, partial [Clostridia bacterium]|nr:hypothetical protein [Clostridia bacterium]
NYISFINILNNLFISTRQIDHNDEYKVNQLINEIFNQKNLSMASDFYLNINNIQILTADFPVTSELQFDDIYNSFNNRARQRSFKLVFCNRSSYGRSGGRNTHRDFTDSGGCSGGHLSLPS